MGPKGDRPKPDGRRHLEGFTGRLAEHQWTGRRSDPFNRSRSSNLKQGGRDDEPVESALSRFHAKRRRGAYDDLDQRPVAPKFATPT